MGYKLGNHLTVDIGTTGCSHTVDLAKFMRAHLPALIPTPGGENRALANLQAQAADIWADIVLSISGYEMDGADDWRVLVPITHRAVVMAAVINQSVGVTGQANP
jgi:hypothetical protein